MEDRTCVQCGKAYDTSTSNSPNLFCSEVCRHKHQRVRKKQKIDQLRQQAQSALNGNNGNGESSSPVAIVEEKLPVQNSKPVSDRQATMHITSSMPPHMALMVDLLKKEATRWEKAYQEEKASKKRLAIDNQALRDRLKEIELKKPTGLQGLAESPLMKDLLPFVGPALGRLAEGIANAAMPGAGQIAGTNGQLDAQLEKEVHDINQWYISLPRQQQQEVFAILDMLANAKSPEAMSLIAKKILTLIKNGPNGSKPIPGPTMQSIIM